MFLNYILETTGNICKIVLRIFNYDVFQRDDCIFDILMLMIDTVSVLLPSSAIEHFRSICSDVCQLLFEKPEQL
jgi:hypothetical protein